LFSPKLEYKNSGYIEPISGTDLNNNQIIQFEFVTSAGLWKLPLDPLFASYKVKFTNTKAKEAPAAGTDDKREKTEKLPASLYYDGKDIDNSCGAYLNPNLGPASFFSGAEVEINGVRVTEAAFGQNIYQCLNRAFTSKEIRKRYAGSDAELLPAKSSDAVSKWPAGYAVGTDLLDVGGQTEADSKYLGKRFSIDGAFLLSCPKNLTMLAIQEKKGSGNGSDSVQLYTLLREGTKVCIRLIKTDPGGRNVGNFQGHSTTAGYSSATTMADVVTTTGTGSGSTTTTTKKVGRYLDAEIKFSELNLLYEVYGFANRNKDVLHSTVRYTKDSFRLSTQNLPSGQREVKKSFDVPGGTKLVYLFFPWHFQIYYDPSTKKGTEYMWEFPTNLHNISISLNGRSYRWTKGLTGLRPLDTDATTDKGSALPSYGTRDSSLYYSEQKALGIIDNTFGEIFPKSGQRWKDCLVLEFTEDHLARQNTLQVECLFNSPYSETGRMVACMYVFEEDVVDQRGMWQARKVNS